ncbi:MAG: methyltransferase domain-containing protein [Burkholderiales bacterium]
MSWDPAQYLRFEDQRLRPAVDLLARVALPAPRTVVDLGCGAGNVTALLAARWPDADIVGVDNSDAMLEQARAAAAARPRVRFETGDLATWAPAAPADLVYSNAALHWLPAHAQVFARAIAMVREGGALAVQMPDNFGAPSHTAIAELATSPRWRARLAPLVRAAPVARPADYYGWLAPHAATVDVWTTEYLQVLAKSASGEHPVAAWTKGTWLVPFMAALDAGAQREFLAEYDARLAHAYPPLPDGRVLFPFRRLFIVANR